MSGSRTDLLSNVVEVFPPDPSLAPRLIVKLGFDPTASRLHLGHLVLLNKFKQFRDAGHDGIIILGDFTAKVGDPTGRNETRPQLSDEEIAHNVECFKVTLRKILRNDVPMLQNSLWLSEETPTSLISLMSLFTANQMLAKADFAQRHKSGTPIGMHEFVYPLLQGLDSHRMGAQIEIGGVDQKFNIGIGRDIQTKFGSKNPQTGVLMPILTGRDGNEKMSKSKGNTVDLDDSPLEMYSKLEKIPDAAVYEYLRLLTNVPREEYPAENRERQKLMALKVTEVVHGVEEALTAQRAAEGIVLKGELNWDNVPEVSIDEVLFPVKLAVVMSLTDLSKGISDAKRKITSGAVRLNDVKVTDPELIVNSPESLDGVVIRLSRSEFRKFVLSRKDPWRYKAKGKMVTRWE